MDLKFKLKDDSIDSFKDLMKETGLNDGDLITHALSLYKACWREHTRGFRICVVDQDCDILKELVLNNDGTK